MPVGCIEYDGARNKGGYGVLPKAVNGSRLAHRAALAEALGRPVEGVARHTCDNPPCVNPAHLREGTQRQNVDDAIERGRIARGPRKADCRRGHDVVNAGRSSSNGQCLDCRREDSIEQAERRRQARHARGLIRPTPERFRKAA